MRLACHFPFLKSAKENAHRLVCSQPPSLCWRLNDKESPCPYGDGNKEGCFQRETLCEAVCSWLAIYSLGLGIPTAGATGSLQPSHKHLYAQPRGPEVTAQEGWAWKLGYGWEVLCPLSVFNLPGPGLGHWLHRFSQGMSSGHPWEDSETAERSQYNGCHSGDRK